MFFAFFRRHQLALVNQLFKNSCLDMDWGRSETSASPKRRHGMALSATSASADTRRLLRGDSGESVLRLLTRAGIPSSDGEELHGDYLQAEER